MCGIAGEIRFDSSLADVAAVAAMTRNQAARGPDSEGLFSQGPRAFGHRRLRIMDLSERGHQPMLAPELGLGIVFNGAIYNHPQLRAELREKGYHFDSTGDTEVILKAWHCWGVDALRRFQGMFAFALWERDSGRTILARDRLGIKPLYLSRDAARLRFASSLPALLAGGGVDTGIDPVALHHYLSFHAVVPAPHTILNGVKKLPPASYLVIEPDGREHQEIWWRLDFNRSAEDEGASFESWREQTLAALRRSVERRLVADVPVGVLLSGGVDSSLITGLIAEQGGEHLRTYSIGFETLGEERGDEFQYSDIVAQHFATDHEKIFIDSRQLLPELPHAIAAMSEPMVSHDCVAFYLLSRAVAKHSRVVQSGQGADEVFGGYHWYPPLMQAGQGFNTYRQHFFDRDHEDYLRLVAPEFQCGDASGEFVARHFGEPGAHSAIDRALRLDTTVMLVDDPVKRVDNMTMAHGLEARVPFLDHELVELAARIPARHKIASGGKHVLKEAARSVIPSAVIDRPKGYFPVPALKYLRGPTLDYVRDILNQPSALRRGLFQAPYLQELLAAPEAALTPLGGSKLWQVALLESWLQTHVDKRG